MKHEEWEKNLIEELDKTDVPDIPDSIFENSYAGRFNNETGYHSVYKGRSKLKAALTYIIAGIMVLLVFVPAVIFTVYTGSPFLGFNSAGSNEDEAVPTRGIWCCSQLDLYIDFDKYYLGDICVKQITANGEEYGYFSYDDHTATFMSEKTPYRIILEGNYEYSGSLFKITSFEDGKTYTFISKQ